jgi:hypothetical protein
MFRLIWKSVQVGLIFVFAILNSHAVFAKSCEGYLSGQDQAKTRTGSPVKSESAKVSSPILKDYRGVSLGMTATEVRQKLGKPKIKGKSQDLFTPEENELGQIFYDEHEKVYAISIDFTGRNNDAPTPREVIGEDVTANPDGSLYRVKHYSNEGYWVSYNRTNSDPPQITITMQEISNGN